MPRLSSKQWNSALVTNTASTSYKFFNLPVSQTYPLDLFLTRDFTQNSIAVQNKARLTTKTPTKDFPHYQTITRSLSTSMPLTSPSSPLRSFLFTEGALKLFSGTLFLLRPSTILPQLSPSPHSPTSTLLIRALGSQTLAFALPLLLAARSDADSVRSRRIVYWACLAREVGLLAVMAGEWVRLSWWGGQIEEEVERKVEEGKMGEMRLEREERELMVRGLGWWVLELLSCVVGRVWIMGWRGQWFE